MNNVSGSGGFGGRGLPLSIDAYKLDFERVAYKL